MMAKRRGTPLAALGRGRGLPLSLITDKNAKDFLGSLLGVISSHSELVATLSTASVGDMRIDVYVWNGDQSAAVVVPYEAVVARAQAIPPGASSRRGEAVLADFIQSRQGGSVSSSGTSEQEAQELNAAFFSEVARVCTIAAEVIAGGDDLPRLAIEDGKLPAACLTGGDPKLAHAASTVLFNLLTGAR